MPTPSIECGIAHIRPLRSIDGNHFYKSWAEVDPIIKEGQWNGDVFHHKKPPVDLIYYTSVHHLGPGSVIQLCYTMWQQKCIMFTQSKNRAEAKNNQLFGLSQGLPPAHGLGPQVRIAWLWPHVFLQSTHGHFHSFELKNSAPYSHTHPHTSLLVRSPPQSRVDSFPPAGGASPDWFLGALLGPYE